MRMRMNKAPASLSDSEPFSLVDGFCPAATADRVSRPGAQRVGAGSNSYRICNSRPPPSLPTSNLRSWSQSEWGPPGPDANSPRSGKGIGPSMRTHCQTAVPLPYVAVMRGEIAILGFGHFSIIASL